MGVESWPFERERLDTFAEALQSVMDLVGQSVVLTVNAPGSRKTISISGRLQRARNQPREGILFRVGERGFFTLYESEFVHASRSSVDSGSFWGLMVRQAGVELHLSEDLHSPG